MLAHRGWRARYPENTMLALEKAAELPIDGLELDIRRSKDGVILVFHDEKLERTTDGRGPIHNYTWAELQQIDAGCKWRDESTNDYPFSGQGVGIPALETVFRRFPNLWINIDIKQHDRETVEGFAQLVERYNRQQQVCVGSFAEEIVDRIRARLPAVARVANRKEVRRLLILSKLYLERLFQPRGVNFQVPETDDATGIQIVSRRFVRAAHRTGTAVHVWTVNESAQMERLLALGVDGLITDFPDRALKILGRL